jgi:multidrug transporter EmrE-like cation transporter
MISNLLLIYIILIVIFETVAQSCLKKYSQSNNNIYFYVGILFYIGVGCLLCKTYNQKAGLGIVNLIWSACSIIITTIISILIFKEHLHIHDIIASLLITIGILILRFTD